MQQMPREAAEIFRRNVRSVMDDRGLTITDLADEVGTSRPGISRILSGRDGVTLTRAERIARALGFPLAEMISEKIPVHQ